VVKDKPWTREEEKQLIELFQPGLSVEDIAERMKKSPDAIVKKRERLGLEVVVAAIPQKTPTTTSARETWFNANLEVGLGNGWAEYALLPATADDVGATINLTKIQFESNKPEGWVDGWWCFWAKSLESYTLDIYSFPALEIKGIEFSDEGESIVNQGLTVVTDYTGTVIMFVSSTLGQPEGALLGLGIRGIAAIIRLSRGQAVCRCQETISEDCHRQLRFTSILCNSDVVFFKLNPAAGKHCGMTKVVLRGRLTATYCMWEGIPPRLIEVFPYEIGNVEITLCIPWFLRG